MAGYLKAARSPNMQPLQDLVAVLPQVVAVRGDRLTAWRFGRTIEKIGIDEAASLADATGYKCPPGVPRQLCQNRESHIDAVLDAVARTDTRNLSIVVTDLWLSSSDLAQSASMTLSLRFENLFRQGRSIEIAGIAAPYTGPVYDMPWGGNYVGATSRPLYIVLVGPSDLVQAYLSSIETYSASSSAAFNFANVHSSLFANDAFVSGGAPTSGMKLVAAIDGIRPSMVLPNPDFNHIQQFTISRSDLLRANPRAALEGMLDISTRLKSSAIWSGNMEATTSVWMLRDEDAIEDGHCNATTWTSFGSVPARWDSVPSSSRLRRLKVNLGGDLIRLPAGHSYLFASYLDRTDVDTPNAGNDWMRHWSFDLADRSEFQRTRPSFVRTLNLSATASVLEAALRRANAGRRIRVGGFAFVLRIED